MTRQFAKIIADSLGPANVRLTTMEVVIPRIVLAEFNTHRTLCLAGDSVLEFDLPAGSAGRSWRRVHKMRLDEFVDKWQHGARRYAANPKIQYDVSWVDPSAIYTPMEAAARMGMAGQGNINSACRSGALPAMRGADGRLWEFSGADLLRWRASKPEHTRFDMRAKLAGMQIRQLNESTGDIQLSNVVDAIESGEKKVFEVIAGDFSVAGSADHLVLTSDGWKTIGMIVPGDMIIVRKCGTRDDEKRDPMRLKKIDGVWRSQWQRAQLKKMLAEDPLCRRCGSADAVDIHHVEPVYQNPARAFDETNITALCMPCHDDMHQDQDWQVSKYLYGAAVCVESVAYRGIEKTYDLTITGEFPNFLANGVVVHNSRNSASSRAIPVEKMIARVLEDPYIPEQWDINGKGMQGHGVLDEADSARCEKRWLQARDSAVEHTRGLLELGVHKQTTNRLLEPFMWHTIIVTATEWSNFLNLRCHNATHPALRATAVAMRDLLDSTTPTYVAAGGWHLPLVDERDAELDIETKKKLSTARCARVSYMTHDGKRDPALDIELHDGLLANGHLSPLEHPAMALSDAERIGNFRGWVQYRKMIHGEADILGQADR